MVTSKIPQVLPAGTTHFCPAFGRYPNRAFKLKPCDEWAYWTGFDWQDLRYRPVPSVCREMIDVRPKVTGPSIAELIEQGYLAAVPFKCTAAPVAPFTWNGPEDGLPPVGIEVEAWFADNVGPDPVWVPFEVLYLSDHSIVFKTAAGEHQYSLPRFKARGVKLRPIRTADQLAAEKREADAQAMYESLYFAEPKGAWQSLPENTRETFRKAIDKGWQQVKS